MNAAVLVLDVGMRPLRVENWQRAICDLFLGKVEVVEYSKDRTIQGVNRAWPMPSVVRVLHNFKRDRIRVKFSRLNIYTRDNFTCQFCGTRCDSEDLTFDHVKPRSRGGRTIWENIVSACVPCNTKKGSRLPAEVSECHNFLFPTEDQAASFERAVCEHPSVTSASRYKGKVILFTDHQDIDGDVLDLATEQGVKTVTHGMELIQRVRKPSYLPSMTVKMDTRRLPEEWKPYWTATLETE